MEAGNDHKTRDRRIRKVAIASAIGTTVEWYDYFIYGTASALVLGKIFFPGGSAIASTMAAFATFAVGFCARPVGAVVFGHFGDRVGRKTLLVVSLGVMGFATTLIGLLPTYQSIGLAAPAMLVALRLLQGFAVGGEWGGAITLAAEHSDVEKRGLIGSLVQLGSPGGLLLASGIFVIVTSMPTSQFLSWGWRIPFLLSILLLAVGLYIRLSVYESQTFRREKQNAKQPASRSSNWCESIRRIYSLQSERGLPLGQSHINYRFSGQT